MDLGPPWIGPKLYMHPMDGRKIGPLPRKWEPPGKTSPCPKLEFHLLDRPKIDPKVDLKAHQMTPNGPWILISPKINGHVQLFFMDFVLLCMFKNGN